MTMMLDITIACSKFSQNDTKYEVNTIKSKTERILRKCKGQIFRKQLYRFHF